MPILAHLYVHGPLDTPEARETVEKVIALENRKLDMASQLEEISATLDRMEETAVSSANYLSTRLGDLASEVEGLARRLADLEARLTPPVAGGAVS